jgi:hypothetical protein
VEAAGDVAPETEAVLAATGPEAEASAAEERGGTGADGSDEDSAVKDETGARTAVEGEAGSVAKGEHAGQSADAGAAVGAGEGVADGVTAGVPGEAAAAAAEDAQAARSEAVAPAAPAEPAQPVVQPRAGHFTVPTAVAVVPAAPARRPMVEGSFDFFGTQKAATRAGLDSVQNEDLADVVGPEALAVHKADAEAEFKRADAQSPRGGQVIDLTAHDETEQIDVQGLRTAAS